MNARRDILVRIAVEIIGFQQLVAQVEYVGCEEENAEQDEYANSGIFSSRSE